MTKVKLNKPFQEVWHKEFLQEISSKREAQKEMKGSSGVTRSPSAGLLRDLSVTFVLLYSPETKDSKLVRKRPANFQRNTSLKASI